MQHRKSINPRTTLHSTARQDGHWNSYPVENPSEPLQYGYVYKGNDHANYEASVRAMQALGVHEAQLYVDRRFSQDAFTLLNVRLGPGDTLVVPSLSHLGRTYVHIADTWRRLTQEQGVHILVLDLPLADTRRSALDLPDMYVANLVWQMLDYVARSEIQSLRQQEGIAAARARGVRFGRPPKTVPEEFPRLLQMWRRREISSRQAAHTLGIAQDTFLRWSRRAEYTEP